MATPAEATVLVVQVRERDDVARQEQQCFVERCGLPESCFRWANVVREPPPGRSALEGVHAFMIGGSGVLSVTDDHEFTSALTSLTLAAIERGLPCFGACWGHQFFARALGGEVVTDAARAEVGTHPVRLTPEGERDPLFLAAPGVFDAHMGHNDHVTRLPAGCVELAMTERSRNQAFRVAGKPVYGTQFHSELNRARLLERIRIYQAEYVPGGDLDSIETSTREAPYADAILRRFVELFVLPRAASG